MNNISSQLFDQITNITKAHAYDIVSKHAVDLKTVNADLLDNLKNLCNTFGGPHLHPTKNDCAYRAIKRAQAAIERAEMGRLA